MRRGLAIAVITVAGVPGLGAAATPRPAAVATAQPAEEPDPCADVAGRAEVSSCWAREAERAEAEMRVAYEALLRKLTGRAADALRKAQKAWVDAREAQLALHFAIANPEGRHNWDDSICDAIARRELTRQRTQVLKRLARPAADDACLL
jgi:uncharacterized protein YecT (DUF1311 family)